MDENGFTDANEDPMYQWMMQALTGQNSANGQSKSGGGGMGGIMKMFGGGQKQGAYGGTDGATGDSFSQFSGGDFGGGGWA